jgi:hypothetical protein
VYYVKLVYKSAEHELLKTLALVGIVEIWAPTQPICGAAGYGIVVGQISYRKPRWCVEVA